MCPQLTPWPSPQLYDFNIVKAPGLYHYDSYNGSQISNAPTHALNVRSIEIASDVFGGSSHGKEKEIRVPKGFFGAVVQISIIDFIFSFDSIITAIGITNNIPIIVAAVVISMLIMFVASGTISEFLGKYPSLKIVALAFIFMVGVILLADGAHMHIEKAYLYFSLFFTLAVESLNIAARKRK